MKVVKNAARERGLWERLVNSKWEGREPVLSGEESVKAAKRLYRLAMKRPFKGEVKLTSGRRYTWIRRGVLYVNPDNVEFQSRGLRSLIHDMSHYCHQRLNPRDAPHSSRQAYIERDMVDYAVKHGFADGALKSKAKAKPEPEPVAKPDKVVVRYKRMVNRRDKWKAEAERSKRLLSKAEREVKAYERRHGDRLVN